MRERKKLRWSLAAFQILLQTDISWWRYVCKPSLMILFHFHFMAACSEQFLDHPLLRLAKPKMGKSSWLSQSDPEVNTNSTGSLSEGKGMRERMLRGRWIRSQLDGGRDMPRVSSPSYPSGWQGTLLPSITTHTHPSLVRKEEEKKSLPLNDVGCISYLTVGWISSTMWKAFRVKSVSFWYLPIFHFHNVESLQGKKCLLLIFANFPFTAKVGLLPTDLFDITGPDDAARNAKRFERIWEEEKQRCKNSSQKPSLSRSFGF